jgi:hypothetical protein
MEGHSEDAPAVDYFEKALPKPEDVLEAVTNRLHNVAILVDKHAQYASNKILEEILKSHLAPPYLEFLMPPIDGVVQSNWYILIETPERDMDNGKYIVKRRIGRGYEYHMFSQRVLTAVWRRLQEAGYTVNELCPTFFTLDLKISHSDT